MSDYAFAPRAPFAGLATGSTAGGGVIASDRDGLGLATVAVRKGQLGVLTETVHRHYGVELPRGPYRRQAHGLAFAGIGPETWLATQEHAGNDFAMSLRKNVGATASVADQSDGYAVLRLMGPKLRDTLAKLIPLDVHPLTFKPGDVASTVAAHIGATLWRLEDAFDGSPTFEVAVFRSLADSFWHALSEDAAEFGFAVE